MAQSYKHVFEHNKSAKAQAAAFGIRIMIQILVVAFGQNAKCKYILI